MGTINAVLESSPVFAGLEDDDRQNLENLFEKRDMSAGDILSTSGEQTSHFFLLGKGTLLLGMDEGKAVVLNNSGDFIGLELLSSLGRCHTDTTALTSGRVYAILREDFLDLIQDDSQGASIIMESWQDFLANTAPFATILDTIDL